MNTARIPKTKQIYQEKIENAYAKLISWMEKNWLVFFIFLVLVMGVLCFYHLGAKPVQDYDEARHGVNAYEMLKSGDFVVTSYRYKTDYYNLKPPLSMWMIALSYQLLGFNRIALRLYSAICYFLTTLIVSLQVKKRHGVIAGLISMFFFTATMAPLQSHCARNGDADAFFLLMLVVAVFCTLRYAETGRISNLYIASLAFSGAFLAKSFHAGIIVLIMGLFLISVRKLGTVRVRHWIGCILTALGPILVWAVWRFSCDGFAFIGPMIGRDVLRRMTTGVDGNNMNIFTFLRYITGDLTWLSMTLLGFSGVGFLYGSKRALSDNGKFYLVWFIVPFVLYSLSTTKYGWYIFPSTIALTAAAAVIAAKILTQKKLSIMVGIVLLLFFFPVGAMTISNGQLINRERDRDTVQEFMRTELTRDGEYAGKNCYMVYDAADGGYWKQGDVLQAELSADLVTKLSGTEAFMEDTGSYLIIAKNLCEEFELEGYPIIEENKNYVMLRHDP